MEQYRQRRAETLGICCASFQVSPSEDTRFPINAYLTIIQLVLTRRLLMTHAPPIFSVGLGREG
eukprot:9467848-Pyramimonas_sp.AAC.1